MTKHIHYDEIVAWASGEEIEFFNERTGEWKEVPANPAWNLTKYRVKPKPKTMMMVELPLEFVENCAEYWADSNGTYNRNVGQACRKALEEKK